MQPSTSPSPVRATSFANILAEVPQQLGHFFWMSLVAIYPAVHFGSGWILLILLGVELMSFNIHAEEHHKGQSWLRAPLWIFLGIILTISGVVMLVLHHLAALPYLPTLIIGTQAVSFAIHRLAHRHADHHWPEVWSLFKCGQLILSGCGVAFIPFFLF